MMRRVSRQTSLRGLFRLALFCAAATLTATVLASRWAHGQVAESALIAGRQLSRFEDLTAGSHRLWLNGEAVYVAAATTDQPVRELLGRFREMCESGGLGLLRQETEEEGIVACLLPRPAQASTPWLKRFQRFVATGDLEQIGALRYAYARRSRANRTQVIICWTEGAFRLSRLVPLDGKEPPGTDPEKAPRPEGAVRLLSARVEGAPYAVTVYDSKKPPGRVFADYDRALLEHGWQRLPLVAAEVPNSRAYFKGGLDLLVFFSPNGQASLVSIVQTRSR